MGHTPTQVVEARRRDQRRVRLLLKLEHHNPTGSVKDRTALGLLTDLAQHGRLAPGVRIVESTSGNAGVALAALCRNLRLDFTAVVDPKVQPARVAQMLELGADIVVADAVDEHGGYLTSRLDAVQELVREEGAVWTDQYLSPANPAAHYRTTAPEIAAELSPDTRNLVFVPVSTGGTYAGIRRYFADHDPSVEVVAVDSVGSVAIGGDAGPRELIGIGASRPSDHIPHEWRLPRQLISDREAIAVCRELSGHGLALGGSSGAVIAAALKYTADDDSYPTAVCLCPDAGAAYTSTIYSNAWVDATFGTGDVPLPSYLTGFARPADNDPTLLARRQGRGEAG